MWKMMFGARTMALLLVVLGGARAFKDSSPFFLLSSHPSEHTTLDSRPVANAAELQTQLLSSLAGCEYNFYVLLSQPGLKTSYSRHSEVEVMPKLRQRLQEGRNDKTVVEIPHVVGGHLDMRNVSQHISRNCGLHDTTWIDDGPAWMTDLKQATGVVSVRLTEWDWKNAAARMDAFASMDENLASVLPQIPQPHVVIYAASPVWNADRELAHQYEMDETYPSPLHTDLKRDLDVHKKHLRSRTQASGNSSNQQANLPLFETYQFLSPGIFMGLAISLLLFCILYVGVRAIAGLEVSYKAFDKEMGPQAQNKGKQQ